MPSDALPRLPPIERGRISSFRRSLLGYRPGDVKRGVGELEGELGRSAEMVRFRDAQIGVLEAEVTRTAELLEVRDRRVAGLEDEAGRLRAVTAGAEREARELRAELDRARALWDGEMRGLAAAGRQLDELRITARGQATRMRLRALREVAEVTARLGELLDAPARDRDRLLAAVEAAIDRIDAEWDEEEGGRAGWTGPSAAGESLVSAAAGNGLPPARSDPGARGRSPERRFQGRVRVDVGPFSDFSQLVSFEDAANAIGAAGEISIRRFSGGRAQIDLSLAEPVALLRELEERCDLDFRIRSTGDDEIILDVGE